MSLKFVNKFVNLNKGAPADSVAVLSEAGTPDLNMDKLNMDKLKMDKLKMDNLKMDNLKWFLIDNTQKYLNKHNTGVFANFSIFKNNGVYRANFIINELSKDNLTDKDVLALVKSLFNSSSKELTGAIVSSVFRQGISYDYSVSNTPIVSLGVSSDVFKDFYLKFSRPFHGYEWIMEIQQGGFVISCEKFKIYDNVLDVTAITDIFVNYLSQIIIDEDKVKEYEKKMKPTAKPRAVNSANFDYSETTTDTTTDTSTRRFSFDL